MRANPAIFRAYDIRGVYEKDFDAAFAFRLGNALAVSWGAKHLVVGRDGRSSSQELAEQVIAGAQAAGASVTWIRQCSAPVFYYAVDASGAGGGIMVTASHNPGQYNGFKVEKHGATLVGGAELKDILDATEPALGGSGVLQEQDFISSYAEKIVAISGISGPKTVVGVRAPLAVAETIHAMNRRLGLKALVSEPARLMVEFDDDGDRIVFSEDGKPVPADLVFLLLAERLGFRRVVHDLRFSRSVKERLKILGIVATESKVGRLYLHEAMAQADADLGAELSGHFFFRSMGNLEAPELALLYVLHILDGEKRSLTDLTADHRRYFRSDELSLPVKEGIFIVLKEKYSDGTISEPDGLTVEYPDWWFNIRLSNTEPVMRLVVEAKTKELLDQKVSELHEAVGD